MHCFYYMYARAQRLAVKCSCHFGAVQKYDKVMRGIIPPSITTRDVICAGRGLKREQAESCGYCVLPDEHFQLHLNCTLPPRARNNRGSTMLG